MEDLGGASGWAIERFGQRYAADLRQLVPAAVVAGVGRQIDTHLASGLASLHAFGGAWPARYDELVNHVGGLDGVEVVRPTGSQVHYVVVRGSLLVPLRYATDLATPLSDRRVSQRLNKTCRALLTQFGPKPQPTSEQLSLSDELLPRSDTAALRRKLFDDFSPANMTLIPFAANANGGLLAIGWGEAALPADGPLQWVHWEELPIPAATFADGGTPRDIPQWSTGLAGAAGRRFDDAPLDDPSLSPRSVAEQRTVEPDTEQPPPLAPEAGDGANDEGS